MAGELPAVEFAAAVSPPFDPKKVSIRKKLAPWRAGVKHFLAASIKVCACGQADCRKRSNDHPKFLAHNPQDNPDFRELELLQKLRNSIERAKYSHAKKMAMWMAKHGRGYVQQRYMSPIEFVQRCLEIEHMPAKYLVKKDVREFCGEELGRLMGL